LENNLKRLFWWRVRYLVDKYIRNLNEKDDWESRYVIENDDDLQKQLLAIALHDRKMRDIVRTLKYNYILPEDEWIPLGDGRDLEIHIDKLRVRGLNDRDAGKD
jgi:hypothetical protein